MIFLHGTTIMHQNAGDELREKRVRQVEENEESVHDYINYIPVDHVVEKLQKWVDQGAEIIYLSSHETKADIEKDNFVLDKYHFPKGIILYRQDGESYADIAEKIIIPDILIEDDCESIGGEKEMTYTNIKSELKSKIKHIVVREFEGIDHLSDNLEKL